MASLCGKIVISSARKTVLYGSARYANKITMGDPIAHATGLEKRELLAKASGNTNPFHDITVKRGPGTKSQPTEILSAFDARVVGCFCNEDAIRPYWMILHKGVNKRCQCGHWFTLVHISPV